MTQIPIHAKIAFSVPNGHFTALEIVTNGGKLNDNIKNKEQNAPKSAIISDVSEDFSFVTMEIEENKIKQKKDKNNKAKKGEVSRKKFLASLKQ